MKYFKTKLRYSGIIKDGQPIESFPIQERREHFAKMSKKELVELAIATTETINRLWEIYDMEGKDAKEKTKLIR